MSASAISPAFALIPGMASCEVAALGTVYAIEDGKEAAESIGPVLVRRPKPPLHQ
ncbi:hypothetical protein [Bradyrhizobium sp. 930_D9_N1_4]|uniref:hypothetical protein n=1 Tax=Bradyrhizobium sp. 930_D9_N1_4 TaxID=3240374 RepID=UPI003F8ABD26